MSRLQVIVVGLTVGLNALDGFDVLSISFASPGIAAEWGISENNRRAKFYGLTTSGRRQLRDEVSTWQRYAAAMSRVIEPA